jgi:predicted methyltransferase
MGRATYDTSPEIRNGNITRDEGISLVKRFDGEFPEKYIKDCCKYMGISIQEYHDTIEKFRTPHLWKKSNGVWALKNPIWKI